MNILTKINQFKKRHKYIYYIALSVFLIIMTFLAIYIGAIIGYSMAVFDQIEMIRL